MGQDISSRGVCREFWLPFPGRAPSPGRGRVLPVPSSHTQRRVPEGIKGRVCRRTPLARPDQDSGKREQLREIPRPTDGLSPVQPPAHSCPHSFSTQQAGPRPAVEGLQELLAALSSSPAQGLGC